VPRLPTRKQVKAKNKAYWEKFSKKPLDSHPKVTYPENVKRAADAQKDKELAQ
jgi:hypothetical protein